MCMPGPTQWCSENFSLNGLHGIEFGILPCAQEIIHVKGLCFVSFTNAAGEQWQSFSILYQHLGFDSGLFFLFSDLKVRSAEVDHTTIASATAVWTPAGWTLALWDEYRRCEHCIGINDRPQRTPPPFFNETQCRPPMEQNLKKCSSRSSTILVCSQARSVRFASKWLLSGFPYFRVSALEKYMGTLKTKIYIISFIFNLKNLYTCISLFRIAKFNMSGYPYLIRTMRLICKNTWK